MGNERQYVDLINGETRYANDDEDDERKRRSCRVLPWCAIIMALFYFRLMFFATHKNFHWGYVFKGKLRKVDMCESESWKDMVRWWWWQCSKQVLSLVLLMCSGCAPQSCYETQLPEQSKSTRVFQEQRSLLLWCFAFPQFKSSIKRIWEFERGEERELWGERWLWEKWKGGRGGFPFFFKACIHNMLKERWWWYWFELMF